MKITVLLPILLVFGIAIVSPATAASPDGNVEWDGASHVGWLDRDPLCPVDGQAFTVRFQTWRDDLTAARVRVDDGTAVWVTATPAAVRGPYDVWEALVPATAATSLEYVIELTDGADIDYLGAGGMSDTLPGAGFVIDYATLDHAPVGATPLPGGGAVFKVWSPSSTTAHVRGEFNGWGTGNPLTKVGEYFVGRATGASAGQMYKYFFNGSHWNTDARAKSVDPSDNYNARIMDPGGFAWQVDDFAVPPFEEMVIYQLHVGTFSGGNDPLGTPAFPAGYTDVTARAAHLAELGVNAVMLNPITEFPGDLSAGYNPVSQWAPEWKYGTPDELKQMIDTLHQHGIAVLLDIVWNHFSSTDNFLWWYDGTQIYFDDPAVGTPWGDQSDFDDEAVRDYFAESAMNWLTEFRMDGFRMDATDFMNIGVQEASGWSLMQRLNDEMDSRFIDKISIAEQLPDDSWVTRPTGLGGAGFDSQYHDEFTDRLRDEIFDSALGDPEMWKISNIITGSGQYLEGRHATNYLELHDECWPTSGGQRIVKTIDTTAPHDDAFAMGRSKLAQGLVMTAPGIPAILQGTEWLEDIDFGTDPANRIDWSKKTTYAGIFAYYRDLITLRTTSPALRADSGIQVFHLNEGSNVIAFQRYDLNGNVQVVVANFGATDHAFYRIGLPQPGDWSEAINSQDPVYLGDGPINPGVIASEPIAANGFVQSAGIAVPAMGLLVLSQDGLSTVPDPALGAVQGLRLLGAYPNPFNPRITVALEILRTGPVTVAIHDLAGRRVRTLATETYEPGIQRLVWDGLDEAGRAMGSGMYLLHVEGAGVGVTEKIMLVR